MQKSIALMMLMAALAMAAAPAAAKTKKAARPVANSATVECFKQYGASIDPVTKQLTLYATERDGMSRLDAVRACIAAKSGGSRKNIRIPERVPNAGNG